MCRANGSARSFPAGAGNALFGIAAPATDRSIQSGAETGTRLANQDTLAITPRFAHRDGDCIAPAAATQHASTRPSPATSCPLHQRHATGIVRCMPARARITTTAARGSTISSASPDRAEHHLETRAADATVEPHQRISSAPAIGERACQRTPVRPDATSTRATLTDEVHDCPAVGSGIHDIHRADICTVSGNGANPARTSRDGAFHTSGATRGRRQELFDLRVSTAATISSIETVAFPTTTALGEASQRNVSARSTIRAASDGG